MIADQKVEIARLAEQVRLLKALRFQAQSEKVRPHGHEIQYPLFNEAEMVFDEVDSADDKTEILAHTRKKLGRRPISPDLPRGDVVHDILEDEKVCACGCELTRIGEEVSEKLGVIPQKIQVIHHIRPRPPRRREAVYAVEDRTPRVYPWMNEPSRHPPRSHGSGGWRVNRKVVTVRTPGLPGGIYK